MDVRVKPTQDIEELRQNLQSRVENTHVEDGEIILETSDRKEVRKLLESTPGIESFQIDDETFEGLKGRPVQEKIYARLENDRDVAEAFVATVEGYDLVVLKGGLDWHLRLLKRFNPDIRQLSSGRSSIFDVEKSLFSEGPEETVEYELSEEEVEQILRFIQPKSLARGEN